MRDIVVQETLEDIDKVYISSIISNNQITSWNGGEENLQIKMGLRERRG